MSKKALDSLPGPSKEEIWSRIVDLVTRYYSQPEPLSKTLSSEGALTKKNHWDDWHKTHKQESGIFIKIKFKLFPYYQRLSLLFKRVLKKGSCISLLDIGCAPGDWLVYFTKNLGYRVHGVDSSSIGCYYAKEILRRSRLEAEVICKDALDRKFLDKYAG